MNSALWVTLAACVVDECGSNGGVPFACPNEAETTDIER
jgi:hypothetical protein